MVNPEPAAVVVASYRLGRSIVAIGLGLLLCGLVPAVTYWIFLNRHYIGNSIPYREVVIYSALTFGWLCLPVAVPPITASLKSMLFNNGRALWIEDGTLVFLSKKNFAVPCSDIVSLAEGLIGRYRNEGVIVHLCDGRSKSFPTGALTTSRSEVISKLKSLLAL